MPFGFQFAGSLKARRSFQGWLVGFCERPTSGIELCLEDVIPQPSVIPGFMGSDLIKIKRNIGVVKRPIETPTTLTTNLAELQTSRVTLESCGG